MLDVPPLNIISDEQVFSSQNGVDAYLVALYRDMEFEMAWSAGTIHHERFGANIPENRWFVVLVVPVMQ
jgi:hypothetical protein